MMLLLPHAASFVLRLPEAFLLDVGSVGDDCVDSKFTDKCFIMIINIHFFISTLPPT